MPTSAHDDPRMRAASALASSEPFSSREWRFIHTTMYVTPATASSARIVSSPSCCLWGSERLTTSRITATARHSPIARATPYHMGRSDRRSPRWIRNAAMIPTMSEASRPSRSPMMNVGSTRDPSLSFDLIAV